MSNKSFFLNSLKYIIVSGASKGLNYLILLYFAVGIFSEQYVTILLLLSLEQLLNLLLPLNNPTIIYSKTVVDYNKITNKLISTSFLFLCFYIVSFWFFKESIFRYYGVSSLIIFSCILFNVFTNGYIFYLTNFYKLIEDHDKALKVQSLYFISFLSILIFSLILENKVLAFFLGKSVGFLIIIILTKLFKFNITKFRFLNFTVNEWKKMLNLFSISILGWISGLGFINLAKIYSTPEIVLRIGYILNLWNVFLLIGIGVNSVYHPLIKKHITDKIPDIANKIKHKTLLLYLGISLCAYIIYYTLNYINLFGNYPEIQKVFVEIPNTLILFVISAFYYVIHPFYLVYDKFKTFNLLNISAFVFAVFITFTGTFNGYNNYIIYLILLYFFKSSFLYIYGEKKLIKNV